MRHLPLALFASALMVYGCSKTPEPEVQKEEVYLHKAPVQEKAVLPAPVVAPRTTKTKAVIPPEEPLYEEQPLIQEEEVIFIEDSAPSEVQKTYNERQLSRSKDDYPLYESHGGKTYNESQMSQ